MLRALAMVAALAAGLLTAGPRAAAMSFARVADRAVCGAQACIAASGPIEAQSDRQFADFLKAERVGRGAVVVFDSDGGDLLASLRLGNRIRAAGLATRVAATAGGVLRPGGECASACAYAFLGGAVRTLGPGARIGVHQVTTVGGDWAMSAPDGLWLMSQVAAHVSRLCGRADLMIPALATPPQEMHWLSPAELARYAVLSDGAPVRMAAAAGR